MLAHTENYKECAREMIFALKDSTLGIRWRHHHQAGVSSSRGEGTNRVLDLILASNHNLPPVHSTPTRYRPPVHPLPTEYCTNLLSSFFLLVHLCLPYLLCVQRFRAPYPLSCVPSCLLTNWLRTVYIHESYIHVPRRVYSVPPTFRSCTAFSIAHAVRAGLTDIWSPRCLFLRSLVSLLDMNVSI